jgi:hypothetical protein
VARHTFVAAAADDHLLGGVELQTPDVALVAQQRVRALQRVHVPEFDRLVYGGWGEDEAAHTNVRHTLH